MRLHVVCVSVTLRYDFHIGWNTSKILIARPNSLRSLLSVTPTWAVSVSGACHEDVAASTSSRHAGLSIARRLAVARPKLSGRRSSSTVLSQVCLGLPVLRRQSLGGLMQRKHPQNWG